MNYCTVRPVQM